MKKIPLQLKIVSNSQPKEKNPIGTAYLNILKQQTSTIKVLKPDIIFKRSPKNNESSPRNLPKNRKEIEREHNKEENKTPKHITPTVYTLNLNLEVEKPRIQTEQGGSPLGQRSRKSTAKKIKSNQKMEDSQSHTNLNYFCVNHPHKKVNFSDLYFE